MRVAGELEKVTVEMYGYTKNHLQKFIQSTKKVDDVPIENIDYRFITDFDSFLLNPKIYKDAEKTLGRNTASKHHSRFRTILIRGIKEGLISRNPYVDFKLKKTPSKRTYLTEEELKKITDHDLGKNESLDRVRDIFIFSVYTGLRFEDAQQLTIDRIVKDKKGKYIMSIRQEKTNEELTIPVLAPAMKIVEKYSNSAERKILKMVLPKITNQKLNTYLKVIANLVGVNKALSPHVARHTCATTVLLSNDVPMEVVSKWLGHTNIKTTQIISHNCFTKNQFIYFSVQ